ncbi:prolactin-inducible protein homolog [Camelus dromedarius]|uniref:prolactin-inducible protein homolog n=1 Tax=Camelus dromedarius TaxID=9838 RepID=UPI00057BC8CC|nr:prolactin-inducible protein-like [Camelus dromedarius]
MRALQLLLKTSPAALLLILCLRLGTRAAQELPPNIISANLTIIPNGVPTNYLVTFSVTNHETPCVVIKTAIQATPNVVFPLVILLTPAVCVVQETSSGTYKRLKMRP